MSPSKAGLVVVALAAQWALADAPLPVVNKASLARPGAADSTPKSRPGAAVARDASRPAKTTRRTGLLALNS